MRDELQRYKISANVRGAYKIKARPMRYELAKHETRSWTKLQDTKPSPIKDELTSCESSANERRVIRNDIWAKKRRASKIPARPMKEEFTRYSLLVNERQSGQRKTN